MLSEQCLDGIWEFRYSGNGDWQAISVPSAWETAGVPKLYVGPLHYRRQFDYVRTGSHRRVWLDFSGVSYYCSVRLNGDFVGEHCGCWDGFSLDVTGFVKEGSNLLEVFVEKPGGRFPLEESLSGFLPYVQGVMFGGIWKSVSLRESGSVRLNWVHFLPKLRSCQIDVTVSVDGKLTGQDLAWRLQSPNGSLVAKGTAVLPSDADTLSWQVDVPSPVLWSPDKPDRYVFELELRSEGEVSCRHRERFGLREVTVDGNRILLNGEYVYPRGVLHWGWYPDRFAPVPTQDEVRRELADMRSLGYNMVKHCLYVPTRDYLDLCDEVGMLVWLEMPMWWPKVTLEFSRRAMQQYRSILEQVRNHPSLVIYTLGCELDERVPADLLRELYDLTRAVTASPLIKDNSGSAECYGGADQEFGDFYDHHFYAEPHLYPQVLDTFAPRARGAKPWLFGEFCDCDTYRDMDAVFESNRGRPWWLTDDHELNPQGVRWEYSFVRHPERIAESHLAQYKQQLLDGSRKQALLVRKLILETTRSYEEASGYTVLNISDTPLNTPGMYDDLGSLKFSPGDLRPINSDSVLTLGWDRRRVWKNGGDRPFYLDRFCHFEGDVIRPRIQLCYGERTPCENVQLSWRVVRADGSVLKTGDLPVSGPFVPGQVRELAVARFCLGRTETPTPLDLHAKALLGNGQVAENRWRFWVFPRLGFPTTRVFFFDPGYHLLQAEALLPGAERLDSCELDRLDHGDLLLASRWDAGFGALLDRGVMIFLWIAHDDPQLTIGVPFWRESLKIFAEHALWDVFPQEGFADIQFYSIATDRALQTTSVRERLPHARERLILRRVDARHLTLSDYLIEYVQGDGHLIASTLALCGGAGTQASSLEHNVAGRYLLAAILRYLSSEKC